MMYKKSPLRYPGGKSRAIKFLKDFFPKDFIEYREPFFGGGSVGLYLLQTYQNLKIVNYTLNSKTFDSKSSLRTQCKDSQKNLISLFADIQAQCESLQANQEIKFYANDINYDLYCFWQILKTQSTELIQEIQNIKDTCTNGRELYTLLLNRRSENLSDFQRAIDFFILNRISFSGTIDCGGYSQKAFESRFTQSSIERLKDISEVIRDIEFSCKDYESLIQKEGKNVFIFLDPPYFSATKSKLYGKKGDLHTGFNHERLCEILKKTKHTFLLTYDDSEFVRELYKDFYIKEWSLQYGMNNFKQERAELGRELLISNDYFSSQEKRA